MTRSDAGTENGILASCQTYLRRNFFDNLAGEREKSFVWHVSSKSGSSLISKSLDIQMFLMLQYHIHQIMHVIKTMGTRKITKFYIFSTPSLIATISEN